MDTERIKVRIIFYQKVAGANWDHFLHRAEEDFGMEKLAYVGEISKRSGIMICVRY